MARLTEFHRQQRRSPVAQPAAASAAEPAHTVGSGAPLANLAQMEMG
jgi:hypothetical protein